MYRLPSPGQPGELLGLLSLQSSPYLRVIDDLVGRAHTLAAGHVLFGGLPASAAELVSIVPAEESLRLGMQGELGFV